MRKISLLGTSAVFIMASLLCAPPTLAASPQPIKLTYLEGDYGGPTTIWNGDGKSVQGFIEYRQHRKGKRLHIERVARFRDGSSDEDVAEVEVGDQLHAISGRSIIRDNRGKPVVDLRIDIAKKRLSGFYLDDEGRHEVDEEADIGPGTYWGPIFALVVKNFAANAVDGKVVVQSVASTPKPRVFDMEFKRDGSVSLRRTGGSIKTDRITLLPTINFLVDPLLQRFVPLTEFFVTPSEPPTVARFSGPRNYAGQTIRIE